MTAACGARTPVDDGYDGPDVVTALETEDPGSSGAGGKPPAYWVDLCYRLDPEVSSLCLSGTDSQTLTKLQCPADTPIKGEPTYETNLTTGVQRCCYRVAGGVCVNG